MSIYIPPHKRREKVKSEHSDTTLHRRSNQQNDDCSRYFHRVCCINLKRRSDRWNRFEKRLKDSLGEEGRSFIDRIERFDATDGSSVNEGQQSNDVLMEWDATQNSRYDPHIEPPMNKRLTAGELGCALSHVRLWKELAHCDEERNDNILILEDDAIFYRKRHTISSIPHTRGRHRNDGRRERFSANDENDGFFDMISSLWEQLPADWQIVYLGFSDRGERGRVEIGKERKSSKVFLFRPTYGFHTHAYLLRRSAAVHLLSNLPVQGPVDVWLADNHWFGLNVYCGLIANEGWRKTGAPLVSQDRRKNQSDIDQSGRSTMKEADD